MENQEQLVQQPATAVLPGFGELFGKAWQLYTEKFGTFLGIMVPPALLSLLVSVLLTAFSEGKLELGTPFVAGAVLLLVALVMVVVQIWGQVALLCAVRDSQENISVGEAYRRGWDLWLPYLGVAILGTLIVMGGFFLFIIPGIILSIWFSLSTLIVLDEKIKGMDALFKSREYVRGKWWWVFVGFLLVGVLSFVVGFILGFILAFFGLPYTPEISQFIIALSVTPLTFIYMFSLYRSLKAFKGDVSFVSTTGRKAKFISVGVLGIVAFASLMVFVTVMGK